jgi:hypothetical protein
MKPRHTAALGQYRFARGKIDLEIVILVVVSVFVFCGLATLFFKW